MRHNINSPESTDFNYVMAGVMIVAFFIVCFLSSCSQSGAYPRQKGITKENSENTSTESTTLKGKTRLRDIKQYIVKLDNGLKVLTYPHEDIFSPGDSVVLVAAFADGPEKIVAGWYIDKAGELPQEPASDALNEVATFRVGTIERVWE